uniref:Uncharacterized protein n=1 Tax=Oryza sativa subsp. japonica TaxID=39947 RepID=Q8LHW7_ORYSJ|nr:hypothetical protein [Oryza sativa Japonica Group]BAD30950.1 hypothetical protein [Oryza sativa Japonica Group]
MLDDRDRGRGKPIKASPIASSFHSPNQNLAILNKNRTPRVSLSHSPSHPDDQVPFLTSQTWPTYSPYHSLAICGSHHLLRTVKHVLKSQRRQTFRNGGSSIFLCSDFRADGGAASKKKGFGVDEGEGAPVVDRLGEGVDKDSGVAAKPVRAAPRRGDVPSGGDSGERERERGVAGARFRAGGGVPSGGDGGEREERRELGSEGVVASQAAATGDLARRQRRRERGAARARRRRATAAAWIRGPHGLRTPGSSSRPPLPRSSSQAAATAVVYAVSPNPRRPPLPPRCLRWCGVSGERGEKKRKGREEG